MSSINSTQVSINAFLERNTVLTQRFGDSLSTYDFYRYIFPKGTLENLHEQRTGGVNALVTVVAQHSVKRKDGSLYKHNPFVRIVTDELETLSKYNANINNFCILSPLSYFGKSPTLKNARWLYALAFDLDNVQRRNLDYLLHLIYTVKRLPKPTLIASSGAGLHLYYVLKTPVPMYPHYVKALNQYKEVLTKLLWNKYTSSDKKVQIQHIGQGYRVVGCGTKIGIYNGIEYRTQGWLTGEPVTFSYLDTFIFNEEQRIDSIINKVTAASTTLAEAKKKWPKWYDKVIIKGDKTANEWTCNVALYNWWVRKIKAEAYVGNRYNCMRILSAYALKCDIDAERLMMDLEDLYKIFSEMTPPTDANFLTRDEMLKAFRQFSHKEFKRITIKSIERLTGFTIPRNRRNGRKRAVHVKLMNFIRDEKNIDWRYHGGRPTALKSIQEFKRKNPYGTKADCQRETKISYPTIRKWWDLVPGGLQSDAEVVIPHKKLSFEEELDKIFNNEGWANLAEQIKTTDKSKE